MGKVGLMSYLQPPTRLEISHLLAFSGPHPSRLHPGTDFLHETTPEIDFADGLKYSSNSIQVGPLEIFSIVRVLWGLKGGSTTR